MVIAREGARNGRTRFGISRESELKTAQKSENMDNVKYAKVALEAKITSIKHIAMQAFIGFVGTYVPFPTAQAIPSVAFAESFRFFLGVLFRRDFVRGFLLPLGLAFRSVHEEYACFH